jgi:hypothetical protein
MRQTCSLLAVAALLAVSVYAAGEDKDKPSSGLGKGGSCTPFQVIDVTGPNKGKQLCYV